MSTTEKTIQDALIALLTAAESDLRVDTRTVKVSSEAPPARFQQKSLPWVIVDEPEMISDEPYTYPSRRKTYNVSILTIDGESVSHANIKDAKERIRQLRENVLDALHASRHLGLAALYVFDSHVEYDVGNDIIEMGNKLKGMPIMLTVPCTVDQ